MQYFAGDRWNRTSARVAAGALPLALLLMTLAGVALPWALPAHLLFWAWFLPATLWVLCLNGGWRDCWQSPAMRWMLALLLLYALSVLWSVDSTDERLLRVVEESVATLGFLAGAWLALRRASTESLRLLSRGLILACLLGAVAALVAYYGIDKRPMTRRLFGSIYLLDFPTYSGPVLLGCLMAAGVLMEKTLEKQRGWWLTLGFVATGVFIFFTQTRGALISFTCLLLLWGSHYLGVARAVLLTLVLGLAGVWLVHAVEPLHRVWLHHFATGLSGRDVIWEKSLLAMPSHPLLGHGAACIFEASPAGKAITATLRAVIRHPHGLPVSIPFYLGGIGLLLWLGGILQIVRTLWRQRQAGAARVGLLALPCLLLATGTEVHTLIAWVDTSWWIWWLPVVTLAAIGMSDPHSPRRVTPLGRVD